MHNISIYRCPLRHKISGFPWMTKPTQSWCFMEWELLYNAVHYLSFSWMVKTLFRYLVAPILPRTLTLQIDILILVFMAKILLWGIFEVDYKFLRVGVEHVIVTPIAFITGEELSIVNLYCRTAGILVFYFQNVFLW